MSWERVKLKELLTIKNGKDHKSLKDGIYPVYGSGGIMRYADKYLYDKESILLPRKGTLNNIQFARTPFWTVDTCYYTVVNTDRVVPYFLYRNLRQFDIEALNTGSAVPSMTFDKYYTIEINLPDLPTQKRIASILSAYDDLIEVNRKQIKLLEEAAERLYREWFIDLRFPGHETATFNADGLPEGWRKENIGNSFDLYLGGTPSRDNSNFWDNGTIPWINSGAVNKSRIIEGNELITELALEKSATKLLPRHCTLVAITGATLGQVSYNEIETCANQSVVAIKEKSNVYDEYMFHFVKHNIEGIINKANGSAQQHINKGILEEYMIILPDVKIIKEYHNRAKLFDQGIFNLMLQSKQAAEARDLLLPRLMNGEIQL